MITITDQAKFKAKDFFNYLNMQLTQAIKKTRDNDLPVKIAYYLEDNERGCQIIFKEDVLSFDEKKHSNLGTWFYNWQLKQGAKKQLKQMKNNVLAYAK